MTQARGNVLYELDGRPALELYKTSLGERAGGLPATGLLFPLSVRADHADQQRLVRTILAVDEATQSLTFAGDVPEVHLAQLMRANFDRLIAGAADSAVMCQSGPDRAALTVAISCVGRRLVLGERVEEELEATAELLPRQIGYYSYGWQLDVAAMLSQMGCLIVPEGTLEKLFRGKPLAETEGRLLAEHARVGHDLVATIPRMEPVAAIIAYQGKRYDGAGTPEDAVSGDAIPFGARVLKLALDFDALVTAGTPSARALRVLRRRLGWYDPVLLDALAAALDTDASYAFRDVAVEALSPGMVVAEDVRSPAGLLLIAKGQEITSSLKLRLESLGALRDLRHTLKVLIPPELRASTAPPDPVGAGAAPA